MGILNWLFGKKTAPDVPNDGAEAQAVLVYLQGSGLPQEVYDEYDLATLEDQLMEVIELNVLGEFDGNEFGHEGVTLFMYAPDAERLFAGIEPVLRAYPLCKNATVTIRYGAPGAPERKLLLETH
jgi:hypothetical protein